MPATSYRRLKTLDASTKRLGPVSHWNHERAGRNVPENLLAQIENLEKEEQSLLRDLARFEKTRAEAEVSFAQDRQRVAELLGQNP